MGPKRRFGRFEVRFKGSANLPNLFKPGKLPDIDTIFSKSLREKILKVGFPSDGSNCKIRFDPTLVFLLKKVDPFSQKLFLKIFEHHKSHFFKNTKGSRFGLLRFGSVLKSKQRFGRFEVRFSEVREVLGSEFIGSFQV